MDRKDQDRGGWFRDDEARRIASPGPMELVQHLLARLPGRGAKTVAHIGPAPLSRLRTLAADFERVVVVGRALGELTPLRGRVDVVLADGTLGRRDPAELDATLEQVHGCLTEGGLLAATFPASPATGTAREMLLRDRTPLGPTLELHEIELQYRLRRSGFVGVRIRRLDSPHGPCLLCLAVRRANN